MILGSQNNIFLDMDPKTSVHFTISFFFIMFSILSSTIYSGYNIYLSHTTDNNKHYAIYLITFIVSFIILLVNLITYIIFIKSKINSNEKWYTTPLSETTDTTSEKIFAYLMIVEIIICVIVLSILYILFNKY